MALIYKAENLQVKSPLTLRVSKLKPEHSQTIGLYRSLLLRWTWNVVERTAYI